MTLVIAHRGASAYAPENTMPAFELAQRQGADMIELDVQRSADGTLVVFHDEYTARWDGKHRRVVDLPVTEIQKLDIHGARVPTLAEVCAFAREHQLRMNVEIKGIGICADVARVLREERCEELTLVSCFLPKELEALSQLAPHLALAYLMGTRTFRPDVRLRESWPFRALQRIGASAWHPTYLIPMVMRVIPRVRRAGYKVNVWTVNDPAVMRRLVHIGVDGIITDTPDVLRKLLRDTPRVTVARRRNRRRVL